MLHSGRNIFNSTLLAKDGEFGRCVDFLFDEEHWRARYMVGRLNRWVSANERLVPTNLVGDPRQVWNRESVPLQMTRGEFAQQSMPEAVIAATGPEKPFVSRLAAVAEHGGRIFGKSGDQKALVVEMEPSRNESSNLRRISRLLRQRVNATDGEGGRVVDCLMEAKSWSVKYLVIDDGNLLPGRQVIVPPSWVNYIDWEMNRLHLSKSVDELEESPLFDPDMTSTPEYGRILSDYYSHPAA